MTNYNHSRFLPERLRSILEQFSSEDELIIVDDASTDSSPSLLQSLAKKDPRIIFLQNSSNLGVVKSVNRALQACRGRYVASLAADDRILPGFIDKTLLILEQHPEIALCCSECAVSFDGFSGKDPTKIETTYLIPNTQKPLVFHKDTIVKTFCTTSFWIPGHTTIVRKEIFDLYSGFEERLGYLCDWFLFHQIALRHGAAYLPEALSVWRQEEKSFSKPAASAREKRAFYLNLFEILSEPRYATLRPLFKKAGLLDYYIQSTFSSLVFNRKHWDLAFYFPSRLLTTQSKRYFRALKRRLPRWLNRFM